MEWDIGIMESWPIIAPDGHGFRFLCGMDGGGGDGDGMVRDGVVVGFCWLWWRWCAAHVTLMCVGGSRVHQSVQCAAASCLLLLAAPLQLAGAAEMMTPGAHGQMVQDTKRKWGIKPRAKKRRRCCCPVLSRLVV